MKLIDTKTINVDMSLVSTVQNITNTSGKSLKVTFTGFAWRQKHGATRDGVLSVKIIPRYLLTGSDNGITINFNSTISGSASHNEFITLNNSFILMQNEEFVIEFGTSATGEYMNGNLFLQVEPIS
jgi:hypothetical protein